MMEGESIVQYCTRVKEVVNSIHGTNGEIKDKIVTSKVLRTVLPIYAIRVSTIKEVRCTPGNTLTLEGVIGRLIAFEMSSFDNYTPGTIKSSFTSQLLLRKRKGKHRKKGKLNSNIRIRYSRDNSRTFKKNSLT